MSNFNDLLNSLEFSKIYKKILELFIPTKNGDFSASFSGYVSYVDRAKELSRIDEQVIRLVGYDFDMYAIWWEGVFENIINQLENSPNSKMLNSARRVMTDVVEGDALLSNSGVFDKIMNPEGDAGTFKVMIDRKSVKLKYSHKNGKILYEIKGGYETFETGLSMDPIRRKIEILINIGGVYNDPRFKLAQKDVAKYSLPSVEKLIWLKARKDDDHIAQRTESNNSKTIKSKRWIIIIFVIIVMLIGTIVTINKMSSRPIGNGVELSNELVNETIAKTVVEWVNKVNFSDNVAQLKRKYNLPSDFFPENVEWSYANKQLITKDVGQFSMSLDITFFAHPDTGVQAFNNDTKPNDYSITIRNSSMSQLKCDELVRSITEFALKDDTGMLMIGGRYIRFICDGNVRVVIEEFPVYDFFD